MRIDNHMAGYRPALAKAKKNTKFVAGSFVPTLSKGSPLDWTTPEERNSNADDGKYEHPREHVHSRKKLEKAAIALEVNGSL
mgnify:CR=1 FL=1